MTKRTRTKLHRRKRSRRKIKRGGDSRNTWIPSFALDMSRNAAYKFENTFGEIGGKYAGVNPSPLNQSLIK